MAYALSRYANGDTNYVAKLNSDMATIEAALNSFVETVTSLPGATAALPKALAALFGTLPSVIGKDSYKCTIAGLSVNVAAGFAWLPGATAVVQNAAPAALDLSAAADGTYYISADASGQPVFSQLATDALYSVVKGGGVLSTLTLLAKIAWGYTDWEAAQSSATNGNFQSLDARLEAIEVAAENLFVTGAFVAGRPGDAALMFAILPTTTATYPVNFVGSRAKAGVAATAETVLSIKKNGLQVGTITFAAGGTAGVFVAAGETSIGSGDELTIVNQATADATLADVRFALHGTR